MMLNFMMKVEIKKVKVKKVEAGQGVMSDL